jgi:hypothetical protein
METFNVFWYVLDIVEQIKSYDGVLEKTERCWWWYKIITYRISHTRACVRIGLNTRPPPMSDRTQAFGPGACGRIVLTASQSMRPPLYAEPLVHGPCHRRTTARSATCDIDYHLVFSKKVPEMPRNYFCLRHDQNGPNHLKISKTSSQTLS